MILPSISIVVFTIIKTPDLQEINFLLGAQTSTSGEFGSNQVATVLGLGFFLTSIAWILNWKITSNKTFDSLLSLLFLLQGLFTFSRGGMIGGAIAFIFFLYFLILKSGNKIVIPVFIKRFSIPIVIIFIATIVYANNLTGGKLLLRYQGETEGTLLGSREKNINSMTSNRNIIFLSDLELWWENPFLGAGAGTSKYMRNEATGTAAHIELSRLLAEHGLPGLMIFILILYTGYTYLKEKDGFVKAFKISFFVLAIFTTFHSATRTFLTPLLLSLCAVNVKIPKITHDTLPGK
jgi:O-antigen ligase